MATQVSANSYLALGNTALGSQSDGPFHDRTTKDLVHMVNGMIAETLPFWNRCRVFEDFQGGRTISTTVGDPWRIKDTSSAGSPTLAVKADVHAGVFEMAHDSQNEAQVLTLYWGDQRTIAYNKDPIFICRLKVPATLTSSDFLVWGLASDQNDTEDSVATNAWFRIEGASLAVKLETDDGTTDTDDKDPSLTLTADTWYDFKIDASNLSDVKFYYRNTNTPAADTEWTALTVSGVTFTIAAGTLNLQPFVQLRKSAAANTSAIQIDYIEVSWAR